MMRPCFRRTLTEKRAWIDDYLKSDLTQEQYAAAKGLPKSGLTHWAHQLKISLKKPPAESSQRKGFSSISPDSNSPSHVGQPAAEEMSFVNLTGRFAEAHQHPKTGPDSQAFLRLDLSLPGGISITVRDVGEQQAVRLIRGLGA